MRRIRNDVATIAGVADTSPLAGILSRFLPSANFTEDVLDHDERQRLMTDTVERLSSQYRGHVIDWREADAINAKIGETFSRRELMMLLQQYENAITSRFEHPPKKSLPAYTTGTCS